MTLHFTQGDNFDNGAFDAPGDPGADGFNLADVSGVAQAHNLPAGDQGMLFWNKTDGVTSNFMTMVANVEASPHVAAIYIADQPANDGTTVANVRAEVDYINAHAPDKIAFINAPDLGGPDRFYPGNYIPAFTDMTQPNDLIGIEPDPSNPALVGGFNVGVIDHAVQEATELGWSISQIVPMYQAGGGGTQGLTQPTSAQEQRIIDKWAADVPNPVMDFADSWGSVHGTPSLNISSSLQAVFATHNAL